MSLRLLSCVAVPGFCLVLNHFPALTCPSGSLLCYPESFPSDSDTGSTLHRYICHPDSYICRATHSHATVTRFCLALTHFHQRPTPFQHCIDTHATLTPSYVAMTHSYVTLTICRCDSLTCHSDSLRSCPNTNMPLWLPLKYAL